MKKGFIAAVLLACLLLTACGVFRKPTSPLLDPADFNRLEDGSITYPGAAQGIDVSSHQGEIDWEKVRADGVDFALIQIGYRGYGGGTLNEDTAFDRNYKEATAAGLQVGVYFYSQALSVEEAQEEAEFVCTILDGRALDLPVFFDWEEYKTGRTSGHAGMILTDYAKAFCERIRAEGYTPGIYFNRSYGDSHFQLDRLGEYSFWLAEPGSYQSYDHPVAFWQYTGSGTVAGISTKVDRDLMYHGKENTDEENP